MPFDIGISCKLNKFEREKIISLRIARRTYKAIARLLEIPQDTVTDIITRHANSSNTKKFLWTWGNIARRIEKETYIKLIESMPHRIEACIRSQGWPTKY